MFCSGTSRINCSWISNQVPPNCWEHASFVGNKASFPWAVLSSAAMSVLLSQPWGPTFPCGWQRRFCAALLGGDRWWRDGSSERQCRSWKRSLTVNLCILTLSCERKASISVCFLICVIVIRTWLWSKHVAVDACIVFVVLCLLW